MFLMVSPTMIPEIWQIVVPFVAFFLLVSIVGAINHRRQGGHDDRLASSTHYYPYSDVESNDSGQDSHHRYHDNDHHSHYHDHGHHDISSGHHATAHIGGQGPGAAAHSGHAGIW